MRVRSMAHFLCQIKSAAPINGYVCFVNSGALLSVRGVYERKARKLMNAARTAPSPSVADDDWKIS
jgi:predicted lipase